MNSPCVHVLEVVGHGAAGVVQLLRIAPPHIAAELGESLRDIDFAVVVAYGSGSGSNILFVGTNQPWQPALLQAFVRMRDGSIDPAQAQLSLAVAPELRPEMRGFWAGCAAASHL